MSHLSNVTNAAGTGNLAGQRTTGRLSADAIEKLVDVLPIADQVTIRSEGTGPVAVSYPPVFEKLTARDQAALKDLPPDVAKEVLANTSANPSVAKLEISNRLLAKAKSLVPGESVSFDPPELFRVSDAAIAYRVLRDTSPQDRARLEGVTFNRVASTVLSEADHHRETDGAAGMDVERGRGVMGKAGFRLAMLFEAFALTAPLGLMLRAWFPHAICEVRTRTIEIGDAQATRMRETMTHEIGHQVMFGKEIDLSALKEWSTLSGWKSKNGEIALGVNENGGLTGFDASVRPTRTDNFVYENFTEDLTPARIKQVAAAIGDPELRREFEQTAKVKSNLKAAIKEIFGVEALGYSMTDPMEDFAESYRAYYLDPALLVKKTPDKFLYLNAISRKFAPDQVAGLFQEHGRDAQKVATQLAGSGLSQETLDKVFRANGVSADARTLGSNAAAAYKAARGVVQGVAEVPAFRQAYMLIQQKSAEQDLGFISTFTKDPAKALGELWGKLSPAEQGQFADEGKRVNVVQKMQRGQMSYVSAATQGYREIEVAAIKGFGRKLLDDPAFRRDLQENPRRALGSVSRNFPPSLLKAVSDPRMQASFKEFARTIDRLMAYDQIPLLGGGDLREAFETNLKNVDEDTLSASLGLLRDNPEKMAKVFVGLEQNHLGDKGGG